MNRFRPGVFNPWPTEPYNPAYGPSPGSGNLAVDEWWLLTLQHYPAAKFLSPTWLDQSHAKGLCPAETAQPRHRPDLTCGEPKHLSSDPEKFGHQWFRQQLIIYASFQLWDVQIKTSEVPWKEKKKKMFKYYVTVFKAQYTLEVILTNLQSDLKKGEIYFTNYRT